MIRLMHLDYNSEPNLEITVGSQFGYYKVLAIGYVNKNVLFRYQPSYIGCSMARVFPKELVDLKNGARHLRKYFKWVMK